MPQQFSAQIFSSVQSSWGSPLVSQIRDAVLVDNDLERGNDASETITPAGLQFTILDGFQQLRFTGETALSVVREFNSGEVTTLVTFSDGTTLSGVAGLYDERTGAYGYFESYHALDEGALAAVGKTIADVTSITNLGFVDHDLSWGDLGFAPSGGVVPDPDPAPVFNLVQGTAGADRLFGTAADDLIRGGDGDDRLTGNAGADAFVFGADARDGNRDRDVITDFNAADDMVVLEDGAQIRSWAERNGNLIVTLEGDRDTIVIQNADSSILSSFSAVDDVFGV